MKIVVKYVKNNKEWNIIENSNNEEENNEGVKAKRNNNDNEAWSINVMKWNNEIKWKKTWKIEGDNMK